MSAVPPSNARREPARETRVRNRGARKFDAPREPGWRPRRWHFHFSFWSLVTILAVLLFLGLSSMALTGRVVTLPDWVTTRVTEEMNANLPSGSISLARVEAGLTRGGRPRLRLVDVGLRDASGLTLAQLNAVEGSFSRRAALRGKLLPGLLELQGAQVTLRRLRDGSLDLALGQNVGASGNLAALLDEVDSFFDQEALADVVQLSATDLTVSLEDARSGRIWQVTDGALEIEPQAAFTDTTIRFNVFNGTEDLASTEFNFRSARDSSEASLALRFDNAAAQDIAAQSPVLAFLSVIDAPISGALRTTVDPSGALEELAGTLRVGEGALVPVPGTPPARFDGAKIYIDFDPSRQRIDFTGASLESEIGTVEAQGHVYLADFRGGWPNSMIGQVHVPHAVLTPPEYFAEPLEIDSGTADLRLRLDPFQIDFGQIVAYRGTHRYEASGKLGADNTGWWIALDAGFDRANGTEALSLWPLTVESNTRDWVASNISEGHVVDGTLAFRKPLDGRFTLNGTFGVEDAVVTPLEGLPPVRVGEGYISLGPKRTVIAAERAELTAPDGSVLDASGTSYAIPTGRDIEKFGTVSLALSGAVRGVLSTLAQEPFGIFDDAPEGDIGPDMARGRAAAEGRITFPIKPGKLAQGEVKYDVTARLSEMSSDVLIAGKLLTADALELHASNAGVEVSGPVRIGLASGDGTWMLPMVNGVSLPATISGTLDITPQGLSEFGLSDVADMVSGSTRGRFDIDLGEIGDAPRLSLSSDLGGLAMSIPGTGWSKAADSTGSLKLEALLGERPEITAMEIAAPGFAATGRVTTSEGGGLADAIFDRVRIGSWLDATVVLTGRGPNLPVAIRVPSGSVDLRYTAFDGGGGGGAPGPRRPLTLALNQLIVTNNIRFRSMRADLDLAGGLSGKFSGELPEGTPVEGTLAQTGKGAAVRVSATQAGQVLRQAGIFDRARDGKLDLTLAPTGGVGTYEGEFTITDTWLVNAPAMAELLSAVSVVGLLDQMQGEGIRFTEVEGRFRLDPNAVTLYRSSAVGPSMGVSLDGYYDISGSKIDMQGVLSPLYILNALGRVFSTRDGEGLVGFNFTLTGSADNPEVNVNPLSILTPGALREIFRRAPPTAPDQ